MASGLWRITFPRAFVYHLGAVNSDHCPLLIDTNSMNVRSHRPFHFEAMWTKDRLEKGSLLGMMV